MAVTTFIPELWSARLLNALEKSHVAANLVNRDYEGEIRNQGDTVHINTIGPVAVKAYTRNTDIAAPDALTTADQSLVISEAKYFNFAVDDVDAVQAAGNLVDAAMNRAAYALADAADAYLLGVMKTGAGKTLPTAKLTDANVYATIVGMRTELDKANVPTAGRFIVVPPEMYALLLQDSRFVAGGGAQAEATVRNGLVGTVAGFTVYESNNVPETSGTYSVIAGVPTATTYAEQIAKTEAYRPDARFADAVKGLHLYGAKVTDGAQLVVFPATF